MIIDAKCINCKHIDGGSFLYASFCRKHKMNIYYQNKVCRFWNPPLKSMDVWMERSNEKSPTSHNKDCAVPSPAEITPKSPDGDFTQS